MKNFLKIVDFGIRESMYTRQAEWMCAIAMMLMVVVLLLPGAVMTGAFAVLKLHGYHPAYAASVLAVISIVRMVALAANGNSKVWGPKVRVYCAIVGGQVWLALFGGLVYEYFAQGRASLGIATYGALLWGECYSIDRATKDVGES